MNWNCLGKIMVTAIFALLMIAAASLLSGCAPSYSDKSGDFKLPPELSDCAIYRVSNGEGLRLYVTRCPHSETGATWSAGKAGLKHSVTVETVNPVVEIGGVEYIPKDKP